MRDWQPDVSMDLAIAHGVVASQFPAFSGLEPRFLGRGWDNFCLEYPNGIVFRLPTRRAGAELVGNEVSALPLIGGLPTEIRVPEFRYRGKPHEGYPYAFVGYPKIPGVTADRALSAPPGCAAAIGRFLRSLHGIDIGDPALSGLLVDEAAKGDPRQILTKLGRRVRIIESRLGSLTPLMLVALGVAEWAAEQPLAPFQSVLVHGDFYARHVIVDADGVTGIIDWGDVQKNDPAVDLSIAYTFFEPEERPAFWAGYGRPSADFHGPVMIARAAMYGFALLAYGLEEDDPASVAMGKKILGRVASGV